MKRPVYFIVGCCILGLSVVGAVALKIRPNLFKSRVVSTQWHSYTNQEGRYFLNYPEGVEVKENITSSVDGVKVYSPHTTELLPLGMTISFQPIGEAETLTDYLTANSWCASITPEHGHPIKIGNSRGLIFENTPCGPGGLTEIDVSNNSYIYTIRIPIYNSRAKEIISTFNFLEYSKALSKTYFNDNLNIQFSYPADFSFVSQAGWSSQSRITFAYNGDEDKIFFLDRKPVSDYGHFLFSGVTESKQTLGNYDWIATSASDIPYCDAGNCSKISPAYYLILDGYEYELTYFSPDLKEVVERVLRTFKITVDYKIADKGNGWNDLTIKNSLSFKYPTNWQLVSDSHTFEAGDAITVKIVGPNQKPDTDSLDGAFFAVSLPLPTDASLDKWLDKKGFYSSTEGLEIIRSEVTKNVSLGGEPAIRIKRCGLGCYTYIFTKHTGKIYGVVYESLGDKKPEHDQSLQTMLNSFKFLN